MAGSDVASNIEDIDEISKRIKISIAPTLVHQEVEAMYNRLSQTASIKGFRKGKAPRQVIEKMHGPSVRADVTERLISSSLYDTIKSKGIEMVGVPQIDFTPGEIKEGITFTATVAVFPRPTVKNYDKFSVEVPKRKVAEADIEQVVERLRESKANIQKLEFRNTAKKGDIVELNLAIQAEGQPAPRPEPVKIPLGEGNLPEEVENALEGMEIGATKEMDAPLPSQVRDPKLKGTLAHYTLTLVGLHEKVLPELTDDFVKSLEQEAKTLLELRLKINESLEKEVEQQAEADVEVAILDELVKRNDFQVPQALIDDEIRNLIARSGIVDPRQMDLEKISVEPFRAGLSDVAIKRVRSAILVDQVAQAEKIEASDAELEARLQEIAEANNVSLDEVKKYLQSEGRETSIKLEIGRTKVIKFLRERSKVKFTDAKPNEPSEETANTK